MCGLCFGFSERIRASQRLLGLVQLLLELYQIDFIFEDHEYVHALVLVIVFKIGPLLTIAEVKMEQSSQANLQL